MPIPDMNNGGYSDKIAENVKEAAAVAPEVMKAHAAAHVGAVGAEETPLKAQIRDACEKAAKASRLTPEGRAALQNVLSARIRNHGDALRRRETLCAQIAENEERLVKLELEIAQFNRDLAQ